VISPGAPGPKLSDAAAGTLPLLVCLMLGGALMVADHRGQIGERSRAALQAAAEPVWSMVALPGALWRAARRYLAGHDALLAENERLRTEMQVNSAKLAQLGAVAAENARLRDLLGGTRDYQLTVQLAGILDVDLDPWRQRVVLNRGSRDGVAVGQALLDAGGMLGQVVRVAPDSATALLVTDASHAVPVQVVRTGVRLVAQGSGRADQLRVPNIPHSADVRVGDVLVTSGIGGRFPAGFPVGTITALGPDDTRLFLQAEARPAARLDRGSEVLLVMRAAVPEPAGPPLPPSQPAAADAAVTPEAVE
jgi:rod shape-determining protein MreC